MTSSPDTPPRQIIVAASCSADATRAIPLAAGLARWAGADLHGILVEQEQAVTITGMATARLITRTGAQVTAPTVSHMRRLLTSDARVFETELAKLARANLRNWTFERLKGDLVARMRAATAQSDILFVGYQGFNRHLSAVILIHSPGQSQRGAFNVATELARDQNARLFIFAAATDEEQRHLASVELQAMSRQTDLAETTTHVFASTAEILNRINRSSAVAVIINIQTGPFQSDADISLLLDVARCPLVIVGSVGERMSPDHQKAAPDT